MKSKTTILKGSNPVRSWILVDLSGKTLGRVATEIAAILMGKNKATFSYHRDDGIMSSLLMPKILSLLVKN